MRTQIKYQAVAPSPFQGDFFLGIDSSNKQDKEVNKFEHYYSTASINEVNPGALVKWFVYGRLVKIDDYWHPGFNLVISDEQSISNKVIGAKMLGKTYKPINPLKGNTTLKRKNSMKTIAIKKILLPTDFSETGLLAMNHAVHMARLLKAHLYILHVIEAFEYAYSIYEPEINIKDSKEVLETISQRLEKIATELSKEQSINVSTLVGSGRPASGIAEAVKENNIDLIVMGTHGANGFEEYFIGSNAHKVVNISPCPVITIQKQATKLGFKNIVMPIDDSPHSRQKVDHVIKLASLYGAKVHLLGLVNSNEKMDENRFNVKLESVENALKKAGIEYISSVVKGTNIALEAMKYSDEVGADLIVIMTDHESNLTGMFLGSLSKQIVNHSKIPVMSIKPQHEYFGGYYPFGSE